MNFTKVSYVLSVLILAGCNLEPSSSVAPLWTVNATKKTLIGSKSSKAKKHTEGIELVSKFKKLPKSGGKTGGAYFAIPNKIQRQVSGKHIKILALISVPEVGGSKAIAFSYSSAHVGNSGWRRADTEAGLRQYVLFYKVPKNKKSKKKNYGKGFIGILGDMYGSGNKIVVKSVSVSIVKQ